MRGQGHPTRRSVMAAGAAGVALAAVPFAARATGYGGAGAARVRYDVDTAEGRAMLDKFARAAAMMRERPTGDPLSWNFQWYTHWVPDNTTKRDEIEKLPEDQRALAKELWNTCRAHDHDQNEGLFLPWHRAYVLYFERIARKVLDDDAFALPYWDLTNPDRRALPGAFLVPADQSNPLWNAERKPEVAAGKAIDFSYNGHSPLNADALDQETYSATDVTQGLCMALDKGVHASVHVLTGTNHGMGAVQWAANDPIFWLLHADMDRLWVSWLQSGRNNPDTDDWLDTEFAFADENGERVTTRVRDVLDIGALGYRYDRLAPVLVALGAGGGAPETTAAAPPPSPPRTRASPPGNVGAAPPTTGAPPPQQAQAPAQQVLSHGPVKVGHAPVQVSLGTAQAVQQQAPTVGVAPPAAPTTTGAPAGGAPPSDRARAAPPPLQAQPPRPSKLYVVIRNLQAKAQPGVLYDVFGKVTANGRTVTARLGSINFFDAVDHGMPGMTMQQSFVSFEVTNTLALLRTPGAKLEITIAANGTPAAGAAPVVGEISLVEKPG